jgi:hypothetical protein
MTLTPQACGRESGLRASPVMLVVSVLRNRHLASLDLAEPPALPLPCVDFSSDSREHV